MSATAGRVVVVGSSNTDMIVRVPHLPKPGETVLGGRFARAAGGKGANQAVAAARAAADVALVACVGDDELGRAARSGFEAEGIDVTGVATTTAAASGVALICVDEDGENAIAVASGANEALSTAHVEACAERISAADVLLLQLETPLDAVEAAARLAHDAGVRVVLDPAPARDLSDAMLACVSVLTPNATEAGQLTGLDVHDAETAEVAARALTRRGAASVIVTLGAAGAVWLRDDLTLQVAGHTVDAIDATGAGDVFSGCLAAALARAERPERALAFANAAAALSVTRVGAQPSAPRRAEIEARAGAVDVQRR